MKSFCLLACLGVAYWASVAVCAPRLPVRHARHVNLNEILDEIDNYNQTQQMEDMILESTRHLAEGYPRCGWDFFCLTHEIFEKHSNSTKHQNDLKILGNLKNYIAPVNCSDILPPRNATEFVQKKTFLQHIKMCVQCRNLNNNTSYC